MAIIMACTRRRVRHLGSEPGGLNMAFNVERKGVLKLMQGQRRSFEQLGRGGSLVQLQERSSNL